MSLEAQVVACITCRPVHPHHHKPWVLILIELHNTTRCFGTKLANSLPIGPQLFFEQRRLEGSTGPSPTEAGNAGALLRLILLGLVIGAPLIALAALAIGALGRRS